MGEERASFRKDKRMEPQEKPLPVWSGSAVVPPGWTPKARILAISSPEELAWVARQVNGVSEGESDCGRAVAFEDMTICLTADIDLGGREWEPIGKDLKHPFKGRFDGRGHRIEGLSITRDEVSLAGLFGFVYFKAAIRNVAVLNCRIRTAIRKGFIGHAAPICAYGFGDILNCCTSGSVELVCEGKMAAAGGLAGGSLICNCYAACQVQVSGARYAFAGGIAGQFTEIISCYSSGKVQAVSFLSSGLAFAGGIGANINNTGIMHCLALNKEGITVAGEGKAEIGRIFGTVSRQIWVTYEKNYASRAITLRRETGGTVSYKKTVDEAGWVDGEAWDGENYNWSDAFDAAADPLHLPLLLTTDRKAYVGGISFQPAAAMLKADYLPGEGETEGN